MCIVEIPKEKETAVQDNEKGLMIVWPGIWEVINNLIEKSWSIHEIEVKYSLVGEPAVELPSWPTL